LDARGLNLSIPDGTTVGRFRFKAFVATFVGLTKLPIGKVTQNRKVFLEEKAFLIGKVYWRVLITVTFIATGRS
jgi:hypothetical protein